MRDDQRQLLTLAGQLPGRLTAEQVAAFFNCQPTDVPNIVAAKLLRPLGHPPDNGVKYYATGLILELSKDVAWMARMTNAIYEYWHKKNSRRRNGGEGLSAMAA